MGCRERGADYPAKFHLFSPTKRQKIPEPKQNSAVFIKGAKSMAGQTYYTKNLDLF